MPICAVFNETCSIRQTGLSELNYWSVAPLGGMRPGQNSARVNVGRLASHLDAIVPTLNFPQPKSGKLDKERVSIYRSPI
jgi:hypothetical protein